MKSERVHLKVGSLYRLHDRDGYVLECLRLIPDDSYSPYTAKVRSTVTGWTMTIHGVNQYEDGSIDWDFSTHGIFTEKHEDGLHEIRLPHRGLEDYN